MGGDRNVIQGTLSLMILKTLETMGPQHGYGIARRIEQVAGSRMILNYGTVYPMLLKLEQEGAITADWGVSDNNRRARFYRLTAAGRRRITRESKQWSDAAALMARFLAPEEGA
jgi:transcriptional regulator